MLKGSTKIPKIKEFIQNSVNGTYSIIMEFIPYISLNSSLKIKENKKYFTGFTKN